MTGRATGHCAGSDTRGYAKPGGGRGRGWGRGRGVPAEGRGMARRRRRGRRGRGGGLGPPWAPEPIDERGSLEQQKDALEARLSSIDERLDRLNEGQKTEQPE